jgi:hypothetical protein
MSQTRQQLIQLANNLAVSDGVDRTIGRLLGICCYLLYASGSDPDDVNERMAKALREFDDCDGVIH